MECYVPNSMFKKILILLKEISPYLGTFLTLGHFLTSLFTNFSPIANQRSLAMLHVKKLKTKTLMMI